MKRLILIVCMVLSLGGLVVEAVRLDRAMAERKALGSQVAEARLRDRGVRTERDEARRAAQKAAVPNPKVQLDPEVDQKIELLLGRYGRMRAWFELHPEQKIPEFQFLKESNWLDALKDGKGDMSAEAVFRAVAADLRRQATGLFAGKLHNALVAYVKASGGFLPSDTAALAGYFKPPIDNPYAVLRRYEMLVTGPTAETGPASRTAIGLTPNAIADPAFDRTLYSIGTGGYGISGIADGLPLVLALTQQKAEVAYQLANPGKSSRRLGDLAPYFEDPADVLQIRRLQTPRAAKN